MPLKEILTSFSNSHLGTESFKLVRYKCEKALFAGGDHAAVYFFIAEYCRAYVNFYEDQEVSPEFAKAKHKELGSYLESLQHSLVYNDTIQIYATLNSTIRSHFLAVGIA